MKIENPAGLIEVQHSIISISLPQEPVLMFSVQLPARQYVGGASYTEKGWLWCAFQEAVQEAGLELGEMGILFEEIWIAFQNSKT